ncbi:MAG: hypothetical protein K2I79_02395, partial [Clostridia bacterium]|nr:hypothetical protein [Clostridia bacterium]
SLFRANSTLKSVIMLALYAVMIGLIYYGVISFQNSINNIDFSGDITANKAVVMMIETIKRIGGWVYPSLFIARAMTDVNGGASFGIYLALIIAMLAAVLLLSKLFFSIRESGAININYVKKEKSLYKDRYKGASIKLSLMRKEFLCVLRESQLALQTFAPVVMLPVLIIVYSVLFGKGSEQQSAMVDSIVFFLVVMGGGINVMASIAISREGDKFALLKTLPVKTKDIVLSKLWLADILSVCIVTICVISGAACKAFSPLAALFAFISGVTLGLGVNCYSLSRDIASPNFRWNNYKELVKKTSKSLIPMLLSLSVGVVNMIVGIICVIYSDKIGAQYVFWIKWGATLALTIAMFVFLRVGRINKMCEKFEKIEN